MIVSLLRRPLLTAALAVLCLAGVVPRAAAESSSEAAAKARAVRQRIAAIQQQVGTAMRDYDAALAGVAASVTEAISADATSDAVERSAVAQQDVLEDRVRQLYMAGGPVALYASVLDAGSPSDLQARMVTIGRVIEGDRTAASAAATASAAAARHAATLQDQAVRRIRTARDVTRVADRLYGLLAEQQQLLAAADAHATAVREAERRLAEQRAVAAALTDARIGALQVMPPVAEFMRLYRAAATTCPGLSWTVLAAIGQVETGHGRDVATSYAGAMGPMEFMPATFAPIRRRRQRRRPCGHHEPGRRDLLRRALPVRQRGGQPGDVEPGDLELQPRRLVRADGARAGGAKRRPGRRPDCLCHGLRGGLALAPIHPGTPPSIV